MRVYPKKLVFLFVNAACRNRDFMMAVLLKKKEKSDLELLYIYLLLKFQTAGQIRHVTENGSHYSSLLLTTCHPEGFL